MKQHLSPLAVIYVFSIIQVTREQTPQKLIVLMLSRPLPIHWLPGKGRSIVDLYYRNLGIEWIVKSFGQEPGD